MSDADEYETADESNHESGEDFSGSEDEWQPNISKNTSSSNTSDGEDDDGDYFAVPPPSKKTKVTKVIPVSCKKTKKLPRFKQNVSLRAKMHKKYNPPPKTSPSTSIQQKPKEIEPLDSGSSGDECLVDPKQLDLKSSFFDVGGPSTSYHQKTTEPPIFDCNGGMELSNSENDDDDDSDDMEDVEETNTEKTTNNFQNFYDFNKAVENVKNKVKKLESKKVAVDPTCDVSSLLAIGESASSNTKKSKLIKKEEEQSDSDWEEVEANETPQAQTTGHDGVIQVTVALPQHQRRKKLVTDEQASLMRQLNRVIKENYVMFHKASLLCHIAHGIYCNKALNTPNLMEAALKLLPNKKCYPDGRTEFKYFESISKWYKTVMKLKSDVMYSPLKKIPSIPISLAIQIKYKEAICKRDFIFIFIILLRAMGIQCRLIMNMVPLPLRPPQTDLCTIKLKKRNDKKTSKSPTKSSTECPPDVKKESPIKKEHHSIKKEPNSIKKEQSPKKIDPSTAKTKITKKETNSIFSPKKTRAQSEKSKQTTNNNSNLNHTENKPKTKSIKEKISNKLKAESSNKTPEKEEKPNPVEINENKLKTKSIKEKISNKLKAESSNKTPEKGEKLNPVEINENKLKTKSIKEKISNKLKAESSNKTPEKEEKPNPVEIKKNSRKRSTSTLPTINIDKAKESSKSTTATAAVAAKKTRKKSPENIISNSKTKEKSRSPSPKFHISPLFLSSHLNDKEKEKKIPKNSKNSNIETAPKRSTRNKLAVPQLDGGNDHIVNKKTLNSSVNGTLKNIKSKRKNSNSDEDFVISPPKKAQYQPTNKVIDRVKRDRRILSTDCEQSPIQNNKSKKKPVNIWIEVFSEVEEKWVTIDLFKNKVHCVENLRHGATTPILYVFAWNNDGSLKDVSARYCPQWNTVTRKMRVEKDWLDEAIRKYLGKKNVRDKAEDRELEKIHIDKPLPTTISEYKNHPLYALERHILKFEGIYPPNAPTLGFVRGEPVYPRDCVHTLHSREIWLKSARVVKPKQQPYKVVKARPKWDKVNREVIKDLPLEIFGYWQTMAYDPPTAENGIVPRNAYGNVELFKECMLPKKTVHLQLPGLNRVCKKLQIDCAPAVIGFDFHQGSCHPLMDGFVVCEEFQDQVIAAWHADKEEAERKLEEKYEQRVYGNWKKLIKGLLIRQRLKIKYNFDSVDASTGKPKKKDQKN